MASAFLTRSERSGSLFSRVTGLVRTGKMKWEDRPLWYDAYVTQPPFHEPLWDIKMPKHGEAVPKLFYDEDAALVRFYREIDNQPLVNMLDQSTSSAVDLFLEWYRAERRTNPECSSDSAFNKAMEKLKNSRKL